MVVSDHTLPEPDDLIDTQVLRHHLFDPFLSVGGVPGGVEEALCSHDEGPVSIRVDRASLHVEGALKDAQLVELED